MVQNTQHQDRDAGNKSNIAQNITYVLALILVLVSLLNVTPAIPGWDSMWQHILKMIFSESEVLNRMAISARFLLDDVNSCIQTFHLESWHNRQFPFRVFGLCLDIALALAAAVISVVI